MPDKASGWHWKPEYWQKAKPWAVNLVLAVVVFTVLSWWLNRASLPVETQLPLALPLANAEGERITIDFSKSEQTLIYFIAPWCTVCHFSMSNVNWLDYFRNEDEAIYVVALSYDSVDDIVAFAKEHELTVPVLLGNPVLQSQFQVDAFPTYYVVDKLGRIKAKDRGYTTFLGLALRF